MKILVTGATGFVGQHLITKLLAKNHNIVAVARNSDFAKSMSWYQDVRFISCDLYSSTVDHVKVCGIPDVLIHLAWQGLPNYNDLFHFERNLFSDYHFLKNMILAGTKHVLVTGTCLEYGLQSGPLSEEVIPLPTTPYGLAKDTLRKFLQVLQKKNPFVFQWARLFYMFGSGQNKNSLLAQLETAINNKDKVFNMSGGEQLRDYLSIEDVASYLALIIENSSIEGIINCCSGEPISVRQLVENRISKREAKIKLNLGYYPYPDYESMAFWGDNQKLKKIIG